MYYFKPMMGIYGRLLTAETEWLMSREGRGLIAKSLWLCRKRYGREEARRYHDALTCVGVIYPNLFPRV